jgi:hypothetical protein
LIGAEMAQSRAKAKTESDIEAGAVSSLLCFSQGIPPCELTDAATCRRPSDVPSLGCQLQVLLPA